MPYTSHGHSYGWINVDQPRPQNPMRCGGPRICKTCKAEAKAAPAPAISIGTPVRYWRGVREGEGRIGRTYTDAQLWSDGKTWVVWIEGCSGCIALTHVEALTEDEYAAARAARASQAPQSPQEGEGGHGAGEGRESAAQGRTEARCGRAMAEGSCPDHPRAEPTVTVRQVDLAEVLAYVIGADDITTLSAGAIDRLFTALKAASEQR